MTKTETYEWLAATLVKEYKLEPEKLTLDAPLEELGIDSLGMAELLFNVEDQFGIVLPREPVQLPTIGDVVDFINGLMLAQRGVGEAPDPPAPANPEGALATPPALSAPP